MTDNMCFGIRKLANWDLLHDIKANTKLLLFLGSNSIAMQTMHMRPHYISNLSFLPLFLLLMTCSYHHICLYTKTKGNKEKGKNGISLVPLVKSSPLIFSICDTPIPNTIYIYI